MRNNHANRASALVKKLRETANNIDIQLDKKVYDLYGVSELDIRLIEKVIHSQTPEVLAEDQERTT